MNQKNSIGERIAMLMKYYGLNKNSLTVKVGLSSSSVRMTSNSVIGKIVNDPEKTPSYNLLREILIIFKDVNARWFVTGEGDMLGKEFSTRHEKGEIRYFKIGPGEPFPDNALGDKATAINIIYGFTDCEIAFDVVGDSMSPRFRPGDILLCSDFTKKSILFGEAYFMVINGTPSIRVIKNSTGELTYTLSAENPRFGDFEVNKADITHLYLIKGIIRREVF